MKNKITIVICTVAVILAWVISHYCYRIILIRGASMEPTYHDMQFVVVDRWHKIYEPGDVAVFRNGSADGVLMKRIVGVGGDRIVIREGTLYVNDDVCPYYRDRSFDYAGILDNEITLGDHEFFVIGDNITDSVDSRYDTVGPVNVSDMIGIVL